MDGGFGVSIALIHTQFDYFNSPLIDQLSISICECEYYVSLCHRFFLHVKYQKIAEKTVEKTVNLSMISILNYLWVFFGLWP